MTRSPLSFMPLRLPKNVSALKIVLCRVIWKKRLKKTEQIEEEDVCIAEPPEYA